MELNIPLDVGLGSKSCLHHLINNLLLGLRLLHGIGVGTARGNKFLQMLDVSLLLFVLLKLLRVVVLLGLDKRVVVTLVVLKLAVGVEVNDMCAYAVQEILRVRNEHEDACVLRQVVLEPAARLHIQMVGGLVEQKKRWRQQKRTPERHTHTPATRKILCGLLQESLAETKTNQDLCGTRFECTRVHPVNTVIDIEQNFGVGTCSFADVLS
mmetsp:Transcript_23424/g.34357  ORF Transcript_23424/g.34357 Transcript_23424/m.34357 type:complete len:211 (-) Transcript_23424:559-1191(-)